MTRQKVNVFWTGGYDSTYRIAQLSKSDVVIQPHYILDHRKSERQELNAIQRITAEIERHPETKCTILPLITFKRSDIPPDNKISAAWTNIREETKLGGQYDWLARYIKFYGNGERFEYSIEHAVTSKAATTLNRYGKLISKSEGVIDYLALDPNGSEPDVMKLFAMVNFPLPLFRLTKTEIREEYKKLNLERLIPLTWFCHLPVKGKPCGICSPCEQVIEAGMSFRLPRSAKIRHWIKCHTRGFIRKRFLGRYRNK